MTARKTLREVLEAERVEGERVRALIRDVDESLGRTDQVLKRGPLSRLAQTFGVR